MASKKGKTPRKAQTKTTAVVVRKRSSAPARRRSTALATARTGPRDATVIATLAQQGITALDAGDVDGARAVVASVRAYAIAMDARTGKRDPSKRR